MVNGLVLPRAKRASASKTSGTRLGESKSGWMLGAGGCIWTDGVEWWVVNEHWDGGIGGEISDVDGIEWT